MKTCSKTIPYAQDNQQYGIWKQISAEMRTEPSSFLCFCLRNPCEGSGSGSGGCRSNNNLAVTQQTGIVTVPTVIQINCNTLSFFFLSVGFLFCQQVRWAIGDGRLNISPEGLMITPPFHQRHLLWPPFSLRKVVLSRERLPP